MSKINYRAVEKNGTKRFFVFVETDDQYLSLTDSAFARKSDSGAAYVGKQYDTKKAAKRAVRYYSKKQEQHS